MRVAWVDTDAGGRIHFTAPFRWAEAAEHTLYREVEAKIDVGCLPRRAVEAHYLRPLRFDDELEFRLRSEPGRTSITFRWQVIRDGELCVEGRYTVVYVDESGVPSALPEDFRAALG